MARKSNPQKTKLIGELEELIQQIDEEGLRFLIEQANVLLYNMKVDEVNKAAEEVNKSRTAASAAKKVKRGSGGEPLVHIEAGAKGSGMVLIINNERKLMDPDEEMLPLVRIAQNASSREEGTRQMFNWLKRERDDIIIDAGLTAGCESMGELYDYLRKNFSIKTK